MPDSVRGSAYNDKAEKLLDERYMPTIHLGLADNTTAEPEAMRALCRPIKWGWPTTPSSQHEEILLLGLADNFGHPRSGAA
ncbi:hypothetical protein OCUBac02_53700 (plasmid) [Bosea sp. ANAM02]|nr:hypothetical protein OCUBac02_53700 [Bosea sp. ANAM02]